MPPIPTPSPAAQLYGGLAGPAECVSAARKTETGLGAKSRTHWPTSSRAVSRMQGAAVIDALVRQRFFSETATLSE